MLETTKLRTLPVLTRAAELTPAAQACCGACRSCLNTNLASGLAAAGLYAARPFGRALRRLRRRAGPSPAR